MILKTRSLNTSPSLPKAKTDGSRARPVEDVVYQVVTVGAILLILGSVWLF